MSALPLVLVGGWGVPVTAVIPLAAHWPGPVIAHSLDDRQICSGSRPDDLLGSWLDGTDAPAVWAGWSLGGQLAMRAATLAPDKVAGVFTCCSTPCFLTRPDWAPGMPTTEFEAFRAGIARQTTRFWKRFLLLQVFGDRQELAGREAWKPWLQGGSPYNVGTLLTGLQWLAELDQRRAWATLNVPQQHFFGEADTLVSPQVIEAIQSTNPSPRSHSGPISNLVPGMAHWPFGDYAEVLARQLARFGEEVQTGLHNQGKGVRP